MAQLRASDERSVEPHVLLNAMSHVRAAGHATTQAERTVPGAVCSLKSSASFALPPMNLMTDMLLAIAVSNKYWLRLRPPRYSTELIGRVPAAASKVNHLHLKQSYLHFA